MCESVWLKTEENQIRKYFIQDKWVDGTIQPVVGY